MVSIHHRSSVNNNHVQSVARRPEGPEELWAVVFDGRVRVNVSAIDPLEAVEKATALMPGLRVAKVYLR